MKSFLVELMACPNCLPEENGLSLEPWETQAGEILSGKLLCAVCGRRYAIDGGIADFLGPSSPKTMGNTLRYESLEALSAYLWSHYGDVAGERSAAAAYRRWSGQIDPGYGPALDAGCAVGRFTFELSLQYDLAVGIDASRNFILTAKKLQQSGRLEFDLPEEGRCVSRRVIALPSAWDPERVEFIIADAQAIPFRRGSFGGVASLNLIDKLPRPMKHLKEVNRVARTNPVQFLFSDPFSWSTGFTAEEEWLGGQSGGRFRGAGFDNVRAIFEGKTREVEPPWTILNQGSIWWRIRNHRNHFELIRSWYFKARR